ncbi:hypothetical protein [uncultured Erythrobacter sp.]|uniref:hypothetical protein n=1 Tax=uncultured Erythrobacter sp. TaxID=263913 RepID=UPI00263227E8|nr:hypothetical protein [uncultured Erythrobacter sp.]
MRRVAFLGVALVLSACQSESTQSPAPQSEQAENEAEPAAGQVDTEEAAEPAGPSATKVAANSSAACSAKEETLFSCTASNGKQIAVCAAGEGRIEYRYGKGDAELVLADPEWASVPYSGGGEAQIAFTNGDTRYIVFSRIVRTNFEPGEPNNPAISDGVIVQRGEKLLNMQACGAGDLKPVDYNVAERLMPQSRNELFTYETGRADPF